jgi:hypothetical protein
MLVSVASLFFYLFWINFPPFPANLIFKWRKGVDISLSAWSLGCLFCISTDFGGIYFLSQFADRMSVNCIINSYSFCTLQATVLIHLLVFSPNVNFLEWIATSMTNVQNIVFYLRLLW